MTGKRAAENVPGKYFISTCCIGCALCPEIAPANFASNLDEGYEYVCKQPADSQEEQLCREALEICPVDAIGNDG